MLGIALLVLAIGLFLMHRYVPALLLFFGFVTNGYQLIPPEVLLAGAPAGKLTDLALIFLVVALVSRLRVLGRAMRRERAFWWAGLFVAFIGLDGLYSVWGLGYDLGGVLRVLRVNLFLLSFGIFLVVPTPVLVRVFHVLAVLTVVQSVVFLLQIPLNQTLLNSTMAGSEVATSVVGDSFVRFYNTPIFLTPTLFYYGFVFASRSRLIHWLVLLVLLLTVVAPLHRVYIFSLVLIGSLFVLVRQSLGKRAFFVVTFVLVGYGLSTVEVVSSRLEEGITDAQKTIGMGSSLLNTDYGTNTFAYRMAHLLERADYITRQPAGYLFGIGLLSEDTQQAEKLSFEVGAYDERIGRKSQVNTGDIAWSLLVLQLGFVGTALFVLLLSQFVRLFYRNRSLPLGLVGMAMVGAAVIASFAGTELLMIPFRTLLMLLAVVVVKQSDLLALPARPLNTRPTRPESLVVDVPTPRLPQPVLPY